MVVVWRVHHAWNLIPTGSIDDWENISITLVLAEKRYLLILNGVELWLNWHM
jgi:hypothetical protein